MCGRFYFSSPVEMMRQIFGVDARINLPARYNIAPSQPIMTIFRDEKGVRHFAPMEWGLVPEWAKEKPAKPMINARIETVTEKPSFRAAIKRTRCLVPFDGWYEWKTINGQKQPFVIRPTGNRPAAFAGIWTEWQGPGGDFALQTVAFLTGDASQNLADIHHRRPMVVSPDNYDQWLMPHDPLPKDFLSQINWLAESEFETFPVGRRVNSVRFDDADCINPVDLGTDDPQPRLL